MMRSLVSLCCEWFIQRIDFMWLCFDNNLFIITIAIINSVCWVLCIQHTSSWQQSCKETCILHILQMGKTSSNQSKVLNSGMGVNIPNLDFKSSLLFQKVRVWTQIWLQNPYTPFTTPLCQRSMLFKAIATRRTAWLQWPVPSSLPI